MTLFLERHRDDGPYLLDVAVICGHVAILQIDLDDIVGIPVDIVLGVLGSGDLKTVEPACPFAPYIEELLEHGEVVALAEPPRARVEEHPSAVRPEYVIDEQRLVDVEHVRIDHIGEPDAARVQSLHGLWIVI